MRMIRSLLARPRIPPILSFAIPTAFRTIPEVLAGPYPIGFDTVTWYAPLLTEAQRNGWGAALGLIVQAQRAPLLNLLLVTLASVLPLQPFAILKIVAPLLFGFLSLCIYLFVQTAFKTSRPTALGIALFVAFYFVTIRMSWDLFRNVFGYSLFLITLRQTYGQVGRRNDVLVSIMAVLTYLAHELVGILLLAVLGILAMRLSWKERKVHIPHVIQVLAGLVFFTFYAHWLVPPGEGFVLGGVVVSPIGLGTNYLERDGFFGYEGVADLYTSVLAVSALALLPLLPLVVRSSWSNASIAIWTGFLLAVGLSPLIVPVFAAPLWHRWIFMAAVPLAILAGIRISKKPPRTILVIGVALVLVAGTYAFLPAESAFPVFASPYTVRFLPSSMLQNTGPMQDSPSTIEAFEWLADSAPSGSVLLTHYAFTGWALVFAGDIEVITYFQAAELDLGEVRAQGEIYTVWWVENVGWYPNEKIDSSFVLVHQVGRIGVFQRANIG
jgi:hypothetical protein